MDTKVVYNEDLHFEHEQWKRELAFWEDEIRIFKLRLEDLYDRWSAKELLTKLDYFENRFKIHETKIEGFKERIYSHELNMSRHYEAGENVIDRLSFEYHVDFREQIQIQRQMYHDLKKEFFAFLTEKMKSDTISR